MKKTSCIVRSVCLSLVLLLCFGVGFAQALCPVGKANKAGREADAAYEAAMAAAENAEPSAEVVLTEPGQGVTGSPGAAPSEGISDVDKASLDGVGVDPDAEIPF